jgi:hypothetical protein
MRMQEEFEDTKGVIRSRKSKKDRQHNGQKDTKEITRICKSKKTDNTMAKRYKRDYQNP